MIASMMTGCVLVYGCTVEATDSLDDDGTTVTTSGSATGGSGGSGGSGGATTGGGAYGPGCAGLCDKVGDAMCPNDTEAACTTECDGLYAQAPEGCVADLDALVACQIETGTVMCEPDGDAKIEGCDAEGQAFLTCLMGTGMGTCYANAGKCNPLTDSCGAGQACDMAQDNMFHCFPPPNDTPIGGTCNAQSGPYCVHGAACVGGTCRAYCCNDMDCTTGACTAFSSGGSVELKACM
jgi:hypothetical protein